MEDLGSDFSKLCAVCGKTLPTQCDVLECAEQQGTTAEAEDTSCQCGATTPCDTDPCLLAHAAELYECRVCGRQVSENTACDCLDCPRVAAAQIRQASLDTPFKLGL